MHELAQRREVEFQELLAIESVQVGTVFVKLLGT
jgi:hypothetical protein